MNIIFLNAETKLEIDKNFENGLKLYFDKTQKNRLSKSVDLLMNAAEKNHTQAQFRLALIFESEPSIIDNEKKAFKWMTHASEQSLDALYNLGRYYFNGIGTKLNVNKAVELYEIFRKVVDDGLSTSSSFYPTCLFSSVNSSPSLKVIPWGPRGADHEVPGTI